MQSLNGGVGSNDAPTRCAENRARMAAALGVAPDASRHLLPDPFARRGGRRDSPGRARRAPRADAHRDARAGPRHRRLHRRLRAGAVRRRASRRGRRRPCRLARRAHRRRSRRRSPRWKSSAPRARASRAALGPTDPPAELRGRRRNSSTASWRPTPRTARFFAPAARAGHAHVRPAGYIGRRLGRAGIAAIEDLGLCTYAEPARFFSYRRTTHRAEPDYGRHINAIALTES